MRTPTEQDLEQFVRREVGHCVSALISTLALGYGRSQSMQRISQGYDVPDMIEQAAELCRPIEDWEEAARQAGWELDLMSSLGGVRRKVDDGSYIYALGWEDAMDGLDPHEREIFEHWIVSDWLAEKLEQEGERVDRDFAGLCIWGRTTTGQSIAQDGVIARIWQKTVGA